MINWPLVVALSPHPLLGRGAVYKLVFESWGGEAADLGAVVCIEWSHALPSTWINKLFFPLKALDVGFSQPKETGV